MALIRRVLTPPSNPLDMYLLNYRNISVCEMKVGLYNKAVWCGHHAKFFLPMIMYMYTRKNYYFYLNIIIPIIFIMTKILKASQLSDLSYSQNKHSII